MNKNITWVLYLLALVLSLGSCGPKESALAQKAIKAYTQKYGHPTVAFEKVNNHLHVTINTKPPRDYYELKVADLMQLSL